MTVWVPQDVLAAVKPFLAAEMGVEVRQNVPPDYKASDPAFLLVANDGGPMAWPVATRPTLRLTAFAAGRTEAVRVAGKAMGLLLCRRVPGIAHVAPGMSIIDDRDDKTKAFFASTTVLITLRTAAL